MVKGVEILTQKVSLWRKHCQNHSIVFGKWSRLCKACVPKTILPEFNEVFLKTKGWNDISTNDSKCISVAWIFSILALPFDIAMERTNLVYAPSWRKALGGEVAQDRVREVEQSSLSLNLSRLRRHDDFLYVSKIGMARFDTKCILHDIATLCLGKNTLGTRPSEKSLVPRPEK